MKSTTALAVFAAALSLSSAAADSAQAAPAARPNIVLILADDLGYGQGPWKLIPQLGSGGFISKPGRIEPEPGGPQGQLYNLEEDSGETRNLWSEHPEIVRRLTALLEKQQAAAGPASPTPLASPAS